jgi:hypothetical protein
VGTEPVAIDDLAAPSQRETREYAFARYFLFLVLLPAVVYLVGFFLVCVPGYERWGGSTWGPILDYAFQTSGQNADIVIFGDSSALFDVDPMMMGRQLGVKVINLPNTIGGLPVIGDMALRRYLDTNRAPRLIILYFCKWDLNYEAAKGTRVFEGEEMLARHGSWHQVISFGLQHPQEVFYFPFRIYSAFGSSAFFQGLAHLGAEPEVVAFRGHVANRLPFPALPCGCELPAYALNEQQSTSVRHLMNTFSTSETGILLYLAPVPGCRNVQKLLLPDELTVAPPAIFPPTDFSADTNYAHLKPNAVDAATALLIAAVRSRLK